MRTGVVTLGIKRRGHEANFSPPSSAKAKNGGAIPPLFVSLHGVVLNYLKARDKFTLTIVTADVTYPILAHFKGN
jgi:hypothetical protein